jgi:hypothetical protein
MVLSEHSDSLIDGSCYEQHVGGGRAGFHGLKASAAGHREASSLLLLGRSGVPRKGLAITRIGSASSISRLVEGLDEPGAETQALVTRSRLRSFRMGPMNAGVGGGLTVESKPSKRS